MHQTPHRDFRSLQNERHWVLAVPAFILLGLVLTAVVESLASHFRSGGALALGVVLLGLPVVVLSVAAVRRAASDALAYLSSSLRWWNLLWMLTFVSALVFRIRSASEIAAEPLDGWAIFRVAVDMVVAFILLGRLALRRTHWVGSMIRGTVGALSVFGLVCLASTAWSVFPPWTLYKSLEYLVDIALLAAILETLDSIDEFRDLFNWTWALYGLLLLSVWMGAVIWPKEALFSTNFQGGTLGMRLQGVMPALSANDVGTFAAIIGLLALARLLPAIEERYNKPWYGLLLLASLVTMVCSQTRTAIAGFALGALLIMIFTRRKGIGTMLTFVAAPIIGIVATGGLIWSYLARGQTEEQLSTLSSRAQWWSFAWQTFLEHPLTGFGAYAAGRFAVLAKLGLGDTSTMHSDYLEITVGTSIWGMVPFLVALVFTWWLMFRYVRESPPESQQRQLAFEALAILALLTFRSVFMTMLTWHPPLHFLAVLGYGEFLRRHQNAAVATRLHPQGILTREPEGLTSELVFEGEGAVRPADFQL
ncbi:MAG: O-antigen ligase family protein [Terriglobia bacterium]